MALALVLLVAGMIVWGPRGQVMVLAGVGLASLAGLEVSIREHVAGYRSHTTLLAGMAGVGLLAALVLSRVSREIALPAGAVVFAATFVALRELFKRRSGGMGFRVR